MAPDNQIGLEAVFENEDFQKGISDYNRAVADADSNTSAAGTAMSDIWNGMAAVGQVAFNAIIAGLSAMALELYAAVDAAMDAEEAMARVNFIVDSVSDRTGVTTDDVNALAESLSKVLPIDDEVIAQAAAMGLTFDGVNKDNIQPLLSAAADLAAFTGKDLPSAMKDLSLSITDPDRAMRLFKEANITLTDSQKKTLKALGDTGDTAGATQFILEQLAQKGIIGLGEAMGQTAKGKFTIMQTALGNLQEALGTGLLEAFKGVFDRITAFATNPKTIAFFTDLGTQIGDFAGMILDMAPDIITAFDDLSNWFKNNKPIIVGVLAALGTALVAFAGVAIGSILSIIGSMAPLLIAMAVIGGAAALLYTAWTENWGGVQEKMDELWAVLQPIFASLQAWLMENIPIAIQYLSDLWTNTLLPAIEAAFSWIVANVIPILIEIVQWLAVNVPIAIQFLSDLWTNTLLPAIQELLNWVSSNLIPLFASLIDWLAVNIPAALESLAAFWQTTLLPAIQTVWAWISTNLIPLFNAINNLLSAVLGVTLRAFAGLWQNVVLPAIQEVGDWISANLLPIFDSVADVIENTVMPALEPFADFIQGALVAAFDIVAGVIQTVIGLINDLTAAINSVTLPDVLNPTSDIALGAGLEDINKELAKMADATLPAVRHEMSVMGTVRDVPGANNSANAARIVNNSSVVRNYLFGARFQVDSTAALIQILSGLA